MSVLIQHVEYSLARAVSGRHKLTFQQLTIEGMSGYLTRCLLNVLCEANHTRYLEVGTYSGSTLVAAMYQNDSSNFTAIDNFSEFNGIKAKTLLSSNILQYLQGVGDSSKRRFIEHDCFSLPPEIKKTIQDINVYLYDGGHSQEDHRRGITEFAPMLAQESVILVDDWKLHHVQDGTREGLRQSGLQVLKEWTLLEPAGVVGWWGGLGVFVCKQPKTNLTITTN